MPPTKGTDALSVPCVWTEEPSAAGARDKDPENDSGPLKSTDTAAVREPSGLAADHSCVSVAEIVSPTNFFAGAGTSAGKTLVEVMVTAPSGVAFTSTVVSREPVAAHLA